MDLLEDNAASGNLVGQQSLQHLHGVGRDDGADAVAVDNADGHKGLVGKIHLGAVHGFDARQLLLQQDAEGLTGLIDLVHYCPPSLV